MTLPEWQPTDLAAMEAEAEAAIADIGHCPICGGPADGTVCGPFCGGSTSEELPTLGGDNQNGAWF
jgi:hypothetical protein